jgi:Schlafen, AlbA_2
MNFATRRAFSEEELRSLLINYENSFAERKTFSDTEGWLKTVTAFANSCPYSDAGVLFVGANNNGTIQEMRGQQNLEELQKTLGLLLKSKIFPPITADYRTLRKDDRECLVVIVHGSAKRPHFVGKAWVRKGPESTREVTEEEYAALFAQRNNKVHRILQWQGKCITHEFYVSGRSGSYMKVAVVKGCDEEYITLMGGGQKPYTIPLRSVNLAVDFERAERLKIIEHRPA